jgi:predicted Zn-dependent protease
MALAELNFAQNKITDATQVLQSLANTASSPEKKLVAQLKLAEMYVSKANVTDAEPLISEILRRTAAMPAHRDFARRSRSTGARSIAPFPICVKPSMISRSRLSY